VDVNDEVLGELKALRRAVTCLEAERDCAAMLPTPHRRPPLHRSGSIPHLSARSRKPEARLDFTTR
jgi:hypothetical protein